VATSKLFSLRLPHAADEREKNTASNFQAVAIRGADSCCRAAKELRERRFLCNEAPLLPLEQCDQPERCDCRYARHTDRRKGPRRADETGSFARPAEEHVDRRHADSRRSEDREAEPTTSTSLDDTYYDYVTRREPDPSA
jgi:hypothetical protein